MGICPIDKIVDLNDNGIILGQYNGRIIMLGGGAKEILGYGTAIALSSDDVRVIGVTGGEPTVWLRDPPETGDYKKQSIQKTLPKNSGWQFQFLDLGWGAAYAGDINNAGCIIGQAVYSGTAFTKGTHGVLLLEMGIGVDANRDGVVMLPEYEKLGIPSQGGISLVDKEIDKTSECRRSLQNVPAMVTSKCTT